jgi:hypothetical protein
MKINIKALELIEKGLSSKTVSKLNESQVEILHNRLCSEQVTEIPAKKTYKVGPKGGKIGNVVVSQDPNTKEVMVTAEEGEMKEDENNVDMEKDPFELSSTQDKRQVGPGSYGDNPQVDKEMDSDDADGMGIMEAKKKKKKKKISPWAICTAQLGKEFGTQKRSMWSAKETNKYERCVKDVKQSLKEGKNPVSLFLESQIMKIVEKNLPPKITKGELLKFLSENNPAVAPTKPKEKPTTRPSEKPKKPPHPFKNPNEKENPAPKAKRPSPEEAKDEVLDVILKLLSK